MTEDENNKNEFEKDFSVDNFEETKLNLNDDKILLKGTISDSTKANESLIRMDTVPFDQTLEIMSQTIASIDAKMHDEDSQLQKLDQLSEIKDQLNRLENSSITTATKKFFLEPEITSGVKNETKEDNPKRNIGHNQQEISELLEKIQTLEGKIQTIESHSNSSNERFEKIESVVERFENLESEIPSLFNNLFKKKNKPNPYKKENIIDEPKILLNKVEALIPKDKANIIEETKSNLENTNKETLINLDYDEKPPGEDKKPKSKNSSSRLMMLLVLATLVAILFFFNKFQIIDLDFNKFTSSVFSLIDSILLQIKFYYFQLQK